MKRFFTALLAIVVFSIQAFSQDFEKLKVQVLNQNFEVNSFFGQIKSSGYTRNYATVDLPENCYGFAYSIVITKNDAPASRRLLFDALQMIPDKRAQMAGQLGELVLEATTNEKIDVYIMNNTQDLSNFYEKKDFNSCDRLKGTNNNCYISTLCRSTKRIYFGLVNNQALQGFFVNLQVVAYYLSPIQKKLPTYNKNNSPTYSKSEFVGKWKDENSTFTMAEDGDIFIRWDSGKTAKGKWNYVNNKLHFDFSGVATNPYKGNDSYDILYWDGSNLKYQQTINGISGATYNAKKISQ